MRGHETLTATDLERFLKRSKASSALPEAPDMPLLLQQILEKAAELVPSESGAILLDEPLHRNDPAAALHFVAVFGPVAGSLIGTSISASEGVAGHVYRTGTAHLAVETRQDEAFAGRIDASTGYETKSIIAAPILIGQAVCGAVELLNRLDGRAYDAHDMLLLEVFASYTASTLQNALDARQAQELARVDDLTGLFNDRYLHKRLREEMEGAAAAGRPCALIFIDLDRFKPINDTHGHLVGSQVLREVGYLLRREMADQNAVMARYGGDEFAVVLPGRDSAAAEELAERIRGAIEAATFLERSYGPELPALGLSRVLTASIGVAAAEPEESTAGEAPTALIRRADQAMYRAKESGKNRVCRASPTGT